jgi:hypothetical protein
VLQQSDNSSILIQDLADLEAVQKLLESILEVCKEEQEEQKSTLELAQKLASAEDALPGISVCI